MSYRFNQAGKGCSPVDYLIPYLVTYDADKKLITARIDYSAFLKKNKSFYNISLMDSNAQDLGYNYVFAEKTSRDSSSGEDDFIWKSANNVTKSAVKTKGYYHLGSNVCQEIGGCNNYSPAQPEYDFYIKKIPSGVHFKLWKNMPSSTSDEADMSYRLIFE